MLRKKYFRFLTLVFSMFPTAKKDIEKNKSSILRSLFICDHQELSTEESIKLLYSSIKDFDAELELRYKKDQEEIQLIKEYFKNKEQV